MDFGLLDGGADIFTLRLGLATSPAGPIELALLLLYFGGQVGLGTLSRA